MTKHGLEIGKVFADFGELNCFIDGLPPPRQGLRRYFRGQCRHYSSMTATGMRSTAEAPKWALWKCYSTLLLAHQWSPLDDSVLGATASEQLRNFLAEHHGNLDSDQMFNAMSVWQYAVGQHYGPGSHFLDISHSIETALWFALRNIEAVTVESPNQPTMSGTVWLRDGGKNELGGFLYVFDAAPWTPGEPLSHGHVVDLGTAPSFFDSARMRTQRGCLMYSDATVDGGDLQGFYQVAANCPIAVKWPMSEGIGLTRTIEEMFPGPEQDEWYRRFLSMPLTPRRRIRRSPAPFEHPMSLTLYLPSSAGELAKTTNPISILNPYLLHPALSQPDGSSTRARDLPEWMLELLRKAVPILLEGPVMASSTPKEMWHPGLLNRDQAIRTDVFDIDTFARLGYVDLDNIFVEFSPLERLGWEAAEPIEMTRAAWLMRKGDKYFFVLFGQTWSNYSQTDKDGATPLIPVGPMQIEYSENHRRFEYLNASNTRVPFESVGDPPVKCFYTLLELLRALSPTLKAFPFPSLVLSKESEVNFACVAARQICRLEKPDTPELRRHLVPRIAGSEEVYAGFARADQSYAGIGYFFVEAQTASFFGEVDVKVIRDSLASASLDPESAKENGPFGRQGWIRQKIGPMIAKRRRTVELG